MSRAYYNENDPFAANWLRNLIAAGLITDGDVDTRSIVDVRPTDLAGYERCHFFAGIGGWDYALQLAGWTGPVWTGSCPCQPFSSAGKRRGTDDERHLWPEFAKLIRECRPATVFGEQVASKDGLGWLDGVFADLEGAGYACAAADLCAAGVGAPHIRQRLFWVADAQSERAKAIAGGAREGVFQRAGCCGVGQSNLHRCQAGDPSAETDRYRSADEPTGEMLRGLGNADSGRWQQDGCDQQGSNREAIPRGQTGWHSGASPWSDYELIRCLEPTKEPGRYVEKWRRVESGLVPLAARVSGRVGRLRGYGNAIVPQLAAEFIQAFKDTE